MTVMIANPQPALTFGSLNLISTDAEAAAQGYRFSVLGDNADWGNPVPIEEKIITWLSDGSIIDRKGHDNRTMNLRVTITAADAAGLALGELALNLQSGQRTTLVWTPPDGLAEPCVFDVLMSQPLFTFDDQSELYVERTWALQITAAPFVRSQNLQSTTRPAPSGTQTLTTVDNCSSATGWTSTWISFYGGTSSPTVSSSGGRVYAGRTYSGVDYRDIATLRVKRSGLSVSMAGTPYLRVEVVGVLAGGYWLDQYDRPLSATPTFTFLINGNQLPVATQNGTAYWVDLTGSGITTLNTVEVVVSYLPGASSSVNVNVGDISRSNVIGDQSTLRQLARTIPIKGSARTSGTIQLTDATAALGLAMVYTTQAVGSLNQPPLRVLNTALVSPSADATAVSGFNSDLGTMHTFDIPVTGLLPGAHLLMARVQHPTTTATRTFTWAARARQGSTNLADAQSGSISTSITAGAWRLIEIGTMVLPPKRLGSSGTVRIELSGPAGVLLDEAWLFNIDSGLLTIVDCGTGSPVAGGASNQLFLDSPSLDWPTQAVWLGTQADRSDAYHAGSEIMCADLHELEPGSLNVFTVTPGSTASALTVQYYDRYHTHVADAA